MRSNIIKGFIITVLVTSVVSASALLALSATEDASREMRRPSGDSIYNGNRVVQSTVYGDRESNACIVAYNQHNLIRLHVVANSDSERDQALKRRVRDLIVDRMTPEFKKAHNLEEARKIAGEHLGEIEDIARKEVLVWGESYPVNAMLGRYNFPIKSYGEVTLPAGEYEAVRVVIGQGQGANWWCVLFPPLCFVDVSKGMSPEIPGTAESVYASEEISHPQEQQVEVRFKFLELLGFDIF